MRDNSGQGKGQNVDRDPTLKDNEGKGGTGLRDREIDNGTDFEVAADRDQPDGQRSPGARGRGEVASSEQVVPSGD